MIPLITHATLGIAVLALVISGLVLTAALLGFWLGHESRGARGLRFLPSGDFDRADPDRDYGEAFPRVVELQQDESPLNHRLRHGSPSNGGRQDDADLPSKARRGGRTRGKSRAGVGDAP